MERERWDDKISEEKKEERDKMLVFGSGLLSWSFLVTYVVKGPYALVSCSVAQSYKSSSSYHHLRRHIFNEKTNLNGVYIQTKKTAEDQPRWKKGVGVG